MSNSRGRESLKELVQELCSKARATSVEEASAFDELVLVKPAEAREALSRV